MKKNIKKIFLFTVILISLVFAYPSNTHAIDNVLSATNSSLLTPSKNSRYMNSFFNHKYVIDKYDVNIKVNENNTYEITETVTAYFMESDNYLYRKIPLESNNTILDNSKFINKAQLTNLSVDNDFTKSKKGQNIFLKIGSLNKCLSGEQNYVIKYTYNLGKDTNNGYDEFLYHIGGYLFDNTAIGNIKLTITMPKEANLNNLSFLSSPKGITDKIQYNVKGNTIIIVYNDIIGPADLLSIKLKLPDNYFDSAGLSFDIKDYTFFILPIIFLLITLFLWYKHGRDDKTIDTVEFYPPEGLNSLDVGCIYKGKAEKKDVVSLLIYLANKGYIEISEIKSKASSKKPMFKIKKLKEYDGQNEEEREFLKGLFSSCRGNKNTVEFSQLYNNFYKTVNTILSNINNKMKKNCMSKKQLFIKDIITILIYLSVYVIILQPCINIYNNWILAVFSLILLFIRLIIMIIDKKGKIYQYSYNTSRQITTISTVIFIMFFIMAIYELFSTMFLMRNRLIYLLFIIIDLICIFSMIICLKYLPKRTNNENILLGKIKGFRNYLIIVEKEQLKLLVSENPNYYYDILPYAYVLGVSDVWIKKFEGITYISNSLDDALTSFMNNALTSLEYSLFTGLTDDNR